MCYKTTTTNTTAIYQQNDLSTTTTMVVYYYFGNSTTGQENKKPIWSEDKKFNIHWIGNFYYYHNTAMIKTFKRVIKLNKWNPTDELYAYPDYDECPSYSYQNGVVTKHPGIDYEEEIKRRFEQEILNRQRQRDRLEQEDLENSSDIEDNSELTEEIKEIIKQEELNDKELIRQEEIIKQEELNDKEKPVVLHDRIIYEKIFEDKKEELFSDDDSDDFENDSLYGSSNEDDYFTHAEPITQLELTQLENITRVTNNQPTTEQLTTEELEREELVVQLMRKLADQGPGFEPYIDTATTN